MNAMLKTRWLLLLALGFVTMATITGAASSNVPELFYTLSLSTSGVSVETHINDELEEFLSGGKHGDMISSMPINLHLQEGENVVQFTLTPVSRDGEEAFSPRVVAILELHHRGDIVDTLSPGDRPIFERKLTEEERSALIEGQVVVMLETFYVSQEDLKRALPRSF